LSSLDGPPDGGQVADVAFDDLDARTFEVGCSAAITRQHANLESPRVE